MQTKSYDRVGLFQRIHKAIHKPIFEPPIDQTIKDKYINYFKRKGSVGYIGEIKDSKNKLDKKKLSWVKQSVTAKVEKKPSPEVMIKIDRKAVSKGGGSASHAINYADYIGRDGDVDVHTSEGLLLDDLESLKEYAESFVENQKNLKGLRNDDERISTNIILSMNGYYIQNKEDFKKATEEFIEKEIIDKGFQCFWAMHSDTENPHLHITVGYRSEKGKRFDISPKDINSLRESYAKSLNSKNIEATATPRWIRGKVEKTISQEKYHMLLNQGLNYKDFHQVEKEFISKIFKENIKTKTHKFLNSGTVKAKKEYFKKRNECLIDFSSQLANSAYKQGFKESSDMLYAYSKALRDESKKDIGNIENINNKTFKEKILKRRLERNKKKRLVKFSYDFDKSKLTKFRIAKKFIAGIKVESNLEFLNASKNKSEQIKSDFNKKLKKESEKNGSCSMIILETKKMKPKDKNKFIKYVFSKTNLQKGFISFDDEIKNKKNKQKINIVSFEKINREQLLKNLNRIIKEIEEEQQK